MRVCLIHYEVGRIVNEPGNKLVMKHFGHMPNIQLLYVASILEQLDVEIMYLDIVAMEMDQTDLESSLLKFKPDIIAMSVYTSHFHTVIKFSKYLKQLIPEARILLGGKHCEIFPTETLLYHDVIDYVCVGEAEMVLPGFIRKLSSENSLEGLKGLVWRDGDQVKYAGPAELNHNLDETPFPARHLVPNQKYFNFISERKNYTVFNTSRGCPFQCLFCEAGGQKWRSRSAKNVVDEFEQCFESFQIREVDIFDSSFTINKQRVLDICNELIARGLNKKMIWNARSRVDTIDREMLEALKEAGCYRIFYGIESGNAKILKLLRKSTDLSKIKKTIQLTKKIGISTFGYFLVGAPEETCETINQTIQFSKELPLDFAIFNCLTSFPATPLYEQYYLPKKEKDFWKEYVVSEEMPNDFVGNPWTELEIDELKVIAQKALTQFYFRPVQVLRTLKTIGSFEQFRRYVLAGFEFLFSRIRSGHGAG